MNGLTVLLLELALLSRRYHQQCFAWPDRKAECHAVSIPVSSTRSVNSSIRHVLIMVSTLLTQWRNVESVTSRPGVQAMPSIFERSRYRLEHERVTLLETLLLLQSRVGASMPPEDWLKLASRVASALFARGSMPGVQGTTEHAQHLVRSTTELVIIMQAKA